MVCDRQIMPRRHARLPGYLRLPSAVLVLAPLLFTVPAHAAAASDAVLNLTRHPVGYLSLLIFFVAYGFVAVEKAIQLRKSKPVMLAAGLVEEARGLLPHRAENALRTVGYRELFEHFDGKSSLEEAVALIKQHTRNYAKRQLTWLRRDQDWRWTPAEVEAVRRLVQEETSAASPDRAIR